MIITEADELVAIFQKTRNLIDRSPNPDGSVCFDALCGCVALEFTEAEIQKVSLRIASRYIDYRG